MRLRPIIGWAVFCFLAAFIAHSIPSVTGTFYFLKGKHLFSNEDYKGAVAAYEQAVNSNGKFARGYVELGSSYYELENYEKAEAAFKTAVSIEDDSCAECGLGMVYHRQGKNQDAENALKKAIQLNPRDPCAFNQLGRMYYDLERYDEAINAFRREIKIRPKAMSYHFIGNSYAYLEKYEQSVNAYYEALRFDPDYDLLYLALGHAESNLGHLTEAIEAYRNAIDAHPRNVEAHFWLGLTELYRGNKPLAIAEYEILRRLDPPSADRLLKVINHAHYASIEPSRR